MKHTIEGFSQEKALELNLDLKDLLILRWILDFQPNMKKEIIDNREYCWINYDYLIKDVPIIGIDNKRVLARRLDKLCSIDLLSKKVIKNKLGTYTYFTVNEKIGCLTHKTQKYNNAQDSKVQQCTRLKSTPKDNSTNNKSTNNTYIENNNHLSIPNLEEIRNYVKEKNLNVVPEDFFNFFEANNWVDSRGKKVICWKQKILTWNRFCSKNNNTNNPIKTDKYEYLKKVTIENYIPGSLTYTECMKMFEIDIDNCRFWSLEADKVYNGEYRKG